MKIPPRRYTVVLKLRKIDKDLKEYRKLTNVNYIIRRELEKLKQEHLEELKRDRK